MYANFGFYCCGFADSDNVITLQPNTLRFVHVGVSFNILSAISLKFDYSIAKVMKKAVVAQRPQEAQG
ncbi:hypothetical protein A4A49_38016 [Nicotiana attenuata]|uniref:Uncharacterized protein n=1 Tax=Nicotiana attenuata TaxID=49451 RepID=A0A1J6I0S8_NICAT|nr:hypothetical protein A4A49_38016 [Nicotiana attenuata]